MSARSVPIDPSRPIAPADQPALIEALVAAVRARTDMIPEVAIVLGSGLGGLADGLEDPVAIPFAELPGWPAATAPGHAGRLLLGRLGGRTVAMLQGRFHLYEGNHPGLVIQPVLLFKALGVSVVVLTNAAGGLDPGFGPGTLMVMSDHINLTGLNPLIGRNADTLGDRFPDLTDAWSPRLRMALHAAAAAEGVSSRRVCTSGSRGRITRLRPRSGCWRRSGGTRSGCRRSLSASQRAGSGSRCVASRW